jgi:hypothetical protein
MTELPKERGKVVDELIVNPRRLLIAHVCFGIASAVGLWVRPGTFTPHLPGRVGMGGSPSAFIVVDTAIAWLPYVVAAFVARRLLCDRDDKAVYVYIVFAAIVAVVSIGLYLNAFHPPAAPSPILVSIGTVLALVAIAVMCASIWPGNTAINGG